MELASICDHHRTDMKLFNEVNLLIKQHSIGRQLSFLSDNLTNRLSFVKNLGKSLKTNTLLHEDVNVPLALDGNAITAVFDLEAQILCSFYWMNCYCTQTILLINTTFLLDKPLVPIYIMERYILVTHGNLLVNISVEMIIPITCQLHWLYLEMSCILTQRGHWRQCHWCSLCPFQPESKEWCSFLKALGIHTQSWLWSSNQRRYQATSHKDTSNIKITKWAQLHCSSTNSSRWDIKTWRYTCHSSIKTCYCHGLDSLLHGWYIWA